MIFVFALAAVAGVFSFSWGPIDVEFATLEIQAKGAVVKTIEAEDGAFPESVEVIESYYVIPEGCISCQICVGQCPVNAITMDDNNMAVIDPEICINCGICASGCPTSTIELLDADDCALYGVDADGNSELIQEELEED
ncbi:MAG: 4Fe-4S binding protein [Candidatus Sabulitectum sp.]|nr:4Fe-4S binding protein [Candidatus Sabulitectum sp.]